MFFWWFLLICDCMIPILMAVCGRIMQKHCPKKINTLIGYRTKNSMKNSDTWKFAHEYIGKLWQRMGLWSLAPTVLIHIPFYSAAEDTMGVLSIIVMAVEMVFLIVPIFFTERALKRNFYEDGTKRLI